MTTLDTLEKARLAHTSDTQDPQANLEHLAGSPSNEEPLLSAQEQELLEGYDRLEQLRFELALLSAQEKLSQGSSITSYSIEGQDVDLVQSLSLPSRTPTMRWKNRLQKPSDKHLTPKRLIPFERRS